MYGLLLQSAIEIIRAKYGQEIWEQIKNALHIETNSFSVFQQYGETLFMRVTKNLSEIRNEPVCDLMNIFGTEFVSYISNYGYDRVLRILGHNMRDFLNGLDNLHEYMRYTYPRMRPPSFYVEKESAHGLTLHYRSRRRGYVHYVIGQITEVGRRFYDTNVEIEIISEQDEIEISHVVLELKFENTAYVQHAIANKQSNDLNLAIDCYVFYELFPFHIILSDTLAIISAGDSLTQLFPHIIGELVRDIFTLVRPIVSLNLIEIVSHSNNVFEFASIEPLHRFLHENEAETHEKKNEDTSEMLLSVSTNREVHEEYLRLRGQMLYVEEWKSIIYLATPVLENLDAMFNTGLFINDLSMHDSSRDLVLAGTQQSAELKLALDQEKQKSKALEDSMKKLDVEMKRTDLLLYQMIPKKIADRLRGGEKAATLCETFESCTILFSDVVGFTTICSSLTPMEVVSVLNEMYTKFDKCLEIHNCFKVETIGDAYMLVSGVPERARNHAAEIIDMAFDMLDSIVTVTNPTNNEKLKIRIGCHSGPVVAGIAGIKMPRYCLFGDTVTTANKLEQTSKALHIHVTETTYQLLERKTYDVQERPKMAINGGLTVTTFFILNKKDRNGKVIQRPFQSILKEMKRQETEEAKLKQTNSLKGGLSRPSNSTKAQDNNVVPTTVPASEPPPPPAIAIKSDDTTAKVTKNATLESKNLDCQSLQTNETISELNNSAKIPSRPVRSKACAVL
ncbi:unnamed protein product [Rotaria magnacalcarata]|uniref:guanylate cyclase n=2 Tax=Rotaria magnacalcarata TaxID=392030 RepID=A0A816WRW1_9BILA|nr:unnamed protein product [Rotaria magnacalcarata]CAF1532595.1 unnamed protein product [Rotaria magnacalcarata]CAF2137759.1 unnamed protein product [Rotaria magnacalcarata]CAF3785416.1 unnamed protein product [Rotaria magnacalcarata]CAF3796373.1 unnamed protein product [Rotaria magnacalcarata]